MDTDHCDVTQLSSHDISLPHFPPTNSYITAYILMMSSALSSVLAVKQPLTCETSQEYGSDLVLCFCHLSII